MDEVNKLVESGILELYVLGETTTDESAYVEHMAGLYGIVKDELNEIELALEKYATIYAATPDPTVKPFLMAQVNYMDRLGRGEIPVVPPLLNKHSQITDYAAWLTRQDLLPKDDNEPVVARIIGASQGNIIAIVWLKYGAPAEVHTNEHESFLVVEGSCNILVDGADNHLQPGDFFTIPLYASHSVMVTSSCICKVILQRAAA